MGLMSEQEIFLAALDKEPSERAAFLDQACASNDSLRRGVERLLAVHARVGNVLEQPLPEPTQLGALHDTPSSGTKSVCPQTPAPQGTDSVPLDFLAGSQRPGSLGRLGNYEV